mgnify:CR=1 FL=1
MLADNGEMLMAEAGGLLQAKNGGILSLILPQWQIHCILPSVLSGILQKGKIPPDPHPAVFGFSPSGSLRFPALPVYYGIQMLKDNSGMSVIELLLILVVLIALIMIFKEQLTEGTTMITSTTASIKNMGSSILVPASSPRRFARLFRSSNALSASKKEREVQMALDYPQMVSKLTQPL